MSFFKEWLTNVGVSTSAAVIPYKVTNGIVSKTILEVFNVESPTSRIDFSKSNGESLTLITRYLGLSNETTLSSSGAVISQYGLKLRSVNTCNLVYVMRVFTPLPKVIVLIKQNDGMTMHSECGPKGYRLIKDISMPVVPIGTEIKMSGSFVGNILTYKENDKFVWSGVVPFDKKGICGFRSDNVKVSLSVA